jgi:kynurenine formamidase
MADRDSTADPGSIEQILADAPDNWGKWGEDDELGALNYLGVEAVLRGVGSVSSGQTFTLGAPIGDPGGDLVWPTRSGADHHMLRDKGDFEAGKVTREPYGGWENSDDLVYLFNHGTTHVDAFAHVWYDDELYNGFEAKTTKGGIEHCGIDRVADEGIVGRGVLLDIARHRGVDHLESGERVTLDELRNCADAQGVEVEAGDILLLRTGAMDLFFQEGPEAFYDEFEITHGGEPALDEAGITYTEELVEWFDEKEIPLFGTDTVTAEQTISETTGTRLPLHPVFLRDLGILISEMNDLGDLASDCADDGRYDFLYISAPLHVDGGSGGPVNPIVVK